MTSLDFFDLLYFDRDKISLDDVGVSRPSLCRISQTVGGGEDESEKTESGMYLGKMFNMLVVYQQSKLAEKFSQLPLKNEKLLIQIVFLLHFGITRFV